jgi:hypothetical protein
MANQFQVNVYAIDQTTLARDQSIRYGFPTQGILTKDVSGSPLRSLSSGYNVYGVIIVPSSAAADANGHLYYVQETQAQLATLIG